MSILRGFTVTGLSGRICGLLGGGLGFLLGEFAPGYYRVVYSRSILDDVDPVQLGIGLGVTQGLFIGVVVGLVIVVSITWIEARKLAAQNKVG